MNAASNDIKPAISHQEVPPSPNASSLLNKETIKMLDGFESQRRAVKRTWKNSTDEATEELEGAQCLHKRPNGEENEFDCFGRLVACQLKKLPEGRALESIDFIQHYLVTQRLNSIDNSDALKPGNSFNSVYL